jgi:transposase
MNEAVENRVYEGFLGLPDGWAVEGIAKDDHAMNIQITVVCKQRAHQCPSPRCGGETVLYGTTEKKVWHQDICAYKTLLIIKVPRVKCPEHGVQSVPVPFVDRYSHFTEAHKRRILRLCRSKMPTQQVAEYVGCPWGAIDKLKERDEREKKAADEARRKRGNPGQRLEPKQRLKPKAIKLDEVSFRGHDCSTVISNGDNGRVIAVLPGRDAETLKRWFAAQDIADFSELQSVAIDMAPPYIKAVQDSFPDRADRIICYDRFHVARLFSRTVDEIRRKEAACFNRAGRGNPLAKTRYDWLRNSGRTDNRAGRRRRFLALTRGELKHSQTVKAWKLKETASRLWNYAREGNAKKAWKRLIWRLAHSRIAELKKLYTTVKAHLPGILNAIRLGVTNALAEARNGCIQRIKRVACGFRNKERFHREILFQFG